MSAVDLIATVTTSKFNTPTIEADSAAQQIGAMKLLTAQGTPVYAMYSKITAGASDSNASIYRLFPGLAQNTIPLAIMIGNDANTNGTVYDVCIHAHGVGGAIATSGDAVFASALDLSSAHASLLPGTALDGMKSLTNANFGKTIGTLSGDSPISSQYDITLLADTAGTGGGVIYGLLLFTLG